MIITIGKNNHKIIVFLFVLVFLFIRNQKDIYINRSKIWTWCTISFESLEIADTEAGPLYGSEAY